MNAWLYESEIYCENCITKYLKKTKPDGEYDSYDYPVGPHPEGGGPFDEPSLCFECGTFLQNPLTEEGYAFIKAHPNPIWSEFYKLA